MAVSRAAVTASSGAADSGAAVRLLTRRSRNASVPANSTSRLSAKWRKKVRSVSPARPAISATVVCSNPRSLNSSSAACITRPRGSGSQRPIPGSYAMTGTDILW